ncbi:restriction endonuclease [Pseudomonas aeruginosa]|uniref:restriction endonuclease n=1 Tax=Pseudomonas aeruginosa TaxID=287 RepID=UPI000EAFC542|nr:restriction endonuclease [Pseudomonas aeruginosa]HEN8507879.1 restriction endonuclease [Pseudomonas aeruginosa]HEN8756302.1 restriction endonuclease [Pseudomonas aeruginosa]HEN8806073.1 restriction endonuclease [Pseudomonas aeruginosa]
METGKPDWEKYERLVAKLVSEQISTEYCVTPNAKITGKISSRKRQIDVLIDSRHDTNNKNRIIIDTKIRTRRIDVTHVEAFLGLMTDVGATHGYLVCPNGYTKAAERRAQDSVSIRLLPLDRLENFDPSTWPHCLAPSCRNGRIFWDGYPSIDTILAPLNGGKVISVSYVHYVGKCDRCSRFHVKCLSCNETLSPSHDSDKDFGVQCKCRLPWFWLASIEEDRAGHRSAELHLVKGLNQILTVNRRSL